MEVENHDDEVEILRRMALHDKNGRDRRLRRSRSPEDGGGGADGAGRTEEAQPQEWLPVGDGGCKELYVVDLTGTSTTRDAVAAATIDKSRRVFGADKQGLPSPTLLTQGSLKDRTL